MSEEASPESRPETSEAAPDGPAADWLLLGLAPDADERALRAAYARKLKGARPDVDPEGFQALRAAYDRLRARIEGSADEVEGPPAARGDVPSDVDLGERDALIHRFEARRRRGDVAGALGVVDASLAGSLRMAWREAVEDGLFDAIARDPSTRPALLQGLATRFAWREAATRQESRDAEGMAALRDRLEAADTVDAWRARAEAAREGSGPAGDRVLVRILGPYRVGLFDRGLEPEEDEVAREVMGAVFRTLAEVDGVVDTRTIAALRGALGAAPFGGPKPERIEAGPSEEAQPKGVFNAPSQWSLSPGGWIWIVLVVMVVANGLRTTVDTPPAPSPVVSGPVSNRPPPVALSFAVWKTQGQLAFDLSPLLDEKSTAALRAIRFETLPNGHVETYALDDLTADPIKLLPFETTTVRMRLFFRNGDTSTGFDFALGPAKAQSEEGPAVRPAETGTRPPAVAGRETSLRMRPRLVQRDGRLLIDLSAAASPENRPLLSELRLRTSPASALETLDVAALLHDPMREVPPDSERLTLQFRLTDGTLSKEFVIDPKAVRSSVSGASEAAGRRP